MSDRTRRITRIGSVAGYVVVGSGVVALVTAIPSVGGGQPWRTLNDLALLVEVGALAPLMLSFYELGGRTPTILAQAAQTIGWASALTFCTVLVLRLVGILHGEWHAPVTGAFAIATAALGYIGLWISGANLLAGRWLGPERAVGFLAGVLLALYVVGLLVGRGDTVGTVNGIGFDFLLPTWGVLMGALLDRLSTT